LASCILDCNRGSIDLRIADRTSRADGFGTPLFLRQLTPLCLDRSENDDPTSRCYRPLCGNPGLVATKLRANRIQSDRSVKRPKPSFVVSATRNLTIVLAGILIFSSIFRSVVFLPPQFPALPAFAAMPALLWYRCPVSS